MALLSCFLILILIPHLLLARKARKSLYCKVPKVASAHLLYLPGVCLCSCSAPFIHIIKLLTIGCLTSSFRWATSILLPFVLLIGAITTRATWWSYLDCAAISAIKKTDRILVDLIQVILLSILKMKKCDGRKKKRKEATILWVSVFIITWWLEPE